MIFGSLFSGIEAASVAWAPLGWRCAWVAEIDPFASAVLTHRYPRVPNLGDVNKIDHHAIEPVDIIVFGSPCQSFSVAGQRGGLDDPRGNMAIVGLRLVGQLRPRWVVWENVPGVLSSDGGRDFGAFLGLLGELGYGFAYRVLDAQHFGVPQRRRRVFVVGCLGDWRGAAAVLFEPASLRGDTAPRREAGEGVAAHAVVGTLQSGGTPNGHGTAGINRQAVAAGHILAGTIGAENVRHTTGMESGADLLIFDPTARQPEWSINRPLKTDGPLAVAIQNATRGQDLTYVRQAMSVRRLTPRECECLQGLPDNWTLVPYRGKPAADGPRYRAIGNSMPVPVVRWLGQRIAQFEAATATQQEDDAA